MGNRVSISVPTIKQNLYLHWNGGNGSVKAFIEEAHRRTYGEYIPNTSHANDNTNMLFFMNLYNAVRDFFNYANDEKFSGYGTLSVYLDNHTNNCDNGHKTLNDNFEFEFNNWGTYDEESYRGITDWFKVKHEMLCKWEHE